MSDRTPARRELLRPLQLLGIAVVCGIFAGVVTFVTTGGFETDVNIAIVKGTLVGLSPLVLGAIFAGIGFIATLLILSILILAVDPSQYNKEEMNRPVLLDKSEDDASGHSTPTA